MKYRYIYKTINLLTKNFYIGQHTTYNEYDSYLGSGTELNKDIKKYGRNYFLKGIIEYCDSLEKLNDREIYWIKYYNAIENGYNICKGGLNYPILCGKDNAFFGKKHSDETKKKISDNRKMSVPWNKGLKGVQKCSEQQKIQVSIRHSGENNWNFGKKGELSQNYGLKRSDKTKNKLSTSKKGIKNPNACEFEILTPDNKLFNINYGIPEFLEIHKEYTDKKWVLYHAKRLGEYKGWKISKIN